MWLKAKTPVKILLDDKSYAIVGEDDPAFEVDDTTAAELVKLDAAAETDAPVVAAKAASAEK
jgi:hypothetical protein